MEEGRPPGGLSSQASSAVNAREKRSRRRRASTAGEPLRREVPTDEMTTRGSRSPGDGVLTTTSTAGSTQTPRMPARGTASVKVPGGAPGRGLIRARSTAS